MGDFISDVSRLNRPPRTAAVLLRIGLCCVGLLGTVLWEVHGQEPDAKSPPTDAVVLLQSDLPETITHTLQGGRYRIQVDYSASVREVLDRSVKFLNVEQGEIADVKFQCGDFVKPDAKLARSRIDKPGEFDVETPRFNLEYRFALKWNLDPGRPAREYRKALDENRKEAEKTKDLPTDPIARDRAVIRRLRELNLATIKSIKPIGANRKTDRMGRGVFYEEPSDPAAALEDLYRWLHFDELLKQVDERPDDGWADVRKLAFGQEIMDLLSGAITEDQTKLLTLTQRKKLLQGCEFRVAFEFDPHLVEKQPDLRWKQAFRIRMDGDGPGSALWSIAVGGEGRHQVDWLDLGPTAKSAPPGLEIQGEPNAVATMWVTGPNDVRYLRVVPRSAKSPAAVRIKLTAAPNDRSPIDIPERTRGAATFPF